jgi:hypothetical protein
MAVPPLAEFFDRNFVTHTWTSEPPGEYVFFALLTEPAADPTNPANHLALETASVLKN